ncbi:DNA primase [Thermaerobacillus caldiproteolyticus]|uniref:DNA primase n=1 Tax=Thermaerobacillus caldiproteolyticus TaxID=247480 RepID=UPI00188A813C|nr:DNA primase [Anoxybacillus caldiproteolyticus]QPA30107.1 DNA primase [Anoxybacillus caldiproteolyticus]
MGYRIPEETIEAIRRSVDIVDVISDYVQLKKQGRNYFGLCPFHGEKTPSFSVSPEKQIFHCFGCGAGGNVFSFLMDIEGISFIDAAKRLASRANIDLSHLALDDQRESYTGANEAKKMIEAHELLKKFYHHLLLNTKEGQAAFDYLQARGWTREIIEQFEIGYSPNSWDFAVKFLTGRGFSLELMEKAGLVIRKENGSYFDRFRNRIMFPIHNHHGETVAFSGRMLGEGQPKYLNSPETLIFHKGKILYNFHQARLHIRKRQEAVLFEGFADVVSAIKAGVAYAVATMGTALTEDQARILRRNVESVIICYDGDTAGIEATFRAAELLSGTGCHVKIATIPDGLDPDEYIRKYGSERFQRDVIEASNSFMAFKMAYLRRGKNLQNESDQIRYIEEVLQEISQLTNPIEKDYYLRQLANEFSLSLSALQQQLERYKKTKDKHNDDARERVATRQPLPKKLLPAFQNAERILLAHMLRNRDVALTVQQAIQGEFNIEEHRAIAAYVYAFYEEGNEPDVSLLIARVPDHLKPLVTELSMLLINEEISTQELNDYIKHVLNYPKWLMLKEKEQEKIEAERKKDFLKAARIAKEIIEMKKQLSIS